MEWQSQKWFLFLFLAAYNVLYTLNNLEFWGLVSLLYDVRQSKRLFAIVSAWDGPARLVGYGIALAFASVIGTENLLWIATGFMVCSLLLFIPLAGSAQMKNLAPKHHHHFATQTIQQIQAAITGTKLIRNVAWVSFVSFCFYLVTNFVLYGYVKKQFHNDNTLAKFFAVFLVITRGLTLILKPLFLNRLLDRLGLRKSLLIAPLYLLVFSGITILLTGGNSNKPGFYLFMILAISADILRSAIQSPVLLATLQPLPTPQRLKGHTIIKGLMDPFAFLATGVTLLIISSTMRQINLQMFSALLALLAILWMFVAFSVDSNYVHTLTVAIRNRMLNTRDISITDVNSLNFLLQRINEGDEEEVLVVLNLIAKQPVNREKFFLKALQRDSPKIKRMALRFIQLEHCTGALPELNRMLRDHPDLPVLPQLVRTIAALNNNEDLSGYFDHETQEVVMAAIEACLSQENSSRKTPAEARLRGLLESTDLRQILNGLKIVRKLKMEQFSGEVVALMKHSNETVAQHAIQAGGKLANEQLIKSMLDAFLAGGHNKHLLDALFQSGEIAQEPIRRVVLTPGLDPAKRLKLINLIAKIGGPKAVDSLEQALRFSPGEENPLLAALYQLKFTTKEDNSMYLGILTRSLSLAANLVFLKHFLQNLGDSFELVRQSFQIELNTLKTKCVWLFFVFI